MALNGIGNTVSALRHIARRQNISSNNLANMLTPGFKASRSVAQTTRGGGVDTGEVTRITEPGSLQRGGEPLDLAVAGNGLFQVNTPEGTRFTRAGNFRLSADGRVVTSEGFPVQPEIQVPEEASQIQVARDGTVSFRNQAGERVNAGRIRLARFPNSEGLLQTGRNLLQQGPNSGNPIRGNPGENGLGQVISGMLEGSNTDIVREMTNQIENKHLFSANIEVLKTRDQMMGEVIDLQG